MTTDPLDTYRDAIKTLFGMLSEEQRAKFVGEMREALKQSAVEPELLAICDVLKIAEG